jgi:hypothetical protein
MSSRRFRAYLPDIVHCPEYKAMVTNQRDRYMLTSVDLWAAVTAIRCGCPHQKYSYAFFRRSPSALDLYGLFVVGGVATDSAGLELSATVGGSSHTFSTVSASSGRLARFGRPQPQGDNATCWTSELHGAIDSTGQRTCISDIGFPEIVRKRLLLPTVFDECVRDLRLPCCEGSHA